MSVEKNARKHVQPPCAGGCVFPPAPDDEIDLIDLWRRLWSRRRWVAAAAALGLTAAALAAFLTAPVYRVEVVLAPVKSGDTGALAQLASRVGGLASMVGLDIPISGTDATEAVAILKSRAFTTAFIKDHDLMPILFADLWDAQSGAWKVDKDEEQPTDWDAYRKFDKEVRSIEEDPKTGLVTLAVEWQDPVLAAQWAGALVTRINAEMRRRAIEEARKSLDYLNRELEGTKAVEVRQAMYRLIEEVTKAMMLADIREEYVFKVIDPPAAPDKDDFIRPKRGLLLAAGLLLGGFAGVMSALLLPGGARRADARIPEQ